MKARQPGINSKLVHGGLPPRRDRGRERPHLPDSTFAFRDAAHGAALFAGQEQGYIYTRIGNPTIAGARGERRPAGERRRRHRHEFRAWAR